jgi:UDP-N-acetylmuramate--alanine ligase
LIFNQIKNPNKRLCSKANLSEIAASFQPGVVIMMGAGDIDTFTEPVKEQLLKYEGR